jgi:uncharacterized cysteine cluster protein YcgN (CxxCxxCC family)
MLNFFLEQGQWTRTDSRQKCAPRFTAGNEPEKMMTQIPGLDVQLTSAQCASIKARANELPWTVRFIAEATAQTGWLPKVAAHWVRTNLHSPNVQEFLAELQAVN